VRKFWLNTNTLLLLIIAAAVLWWATPGGALLSPDSLHYSNTARFLSEGSGFQTVFAYSGKAPMVQYPPVYPLALSPAYLLGMDVTQWARMLNVLFLAGAMWLFHGLLARQMKPGSWIPLFLTAVVGFNIEMLRIQRYALTESLSLALLLTALWALASYVERGRRGSLALAAGTTAVLMLTRYAEWPLWGAGVMSLLLLGKFSARRRIGSAIIYGLVAGIPTGLWLLYNRLRTGGGATGYGVSVSWGALRRLPEIADSFSVILTHYNVPGLARWTILALAVGAAFGLAILCIRKEGWDEAFPPALRIAFLYAAGYVGMLLATLVFSLEGISLAPRRFLGPWMIGVLATGHWLHMIWFRSPPVWRQRISVALSAYAITAILAGGAFAALVRNREEGLASRSVREAGIWTWIQQAPPEIAILGNGIQLVYFYTERLIRPLPPKDRLNAKCELRSGQTSWGEFEKALLHQNGHVVFLRDIQDTTRSRQFISEAQLLDEYPMTTVYQDAKAIVYALELKRK
jgi:hypothetical protein